jgi:phosphoribosylaminoimidazole carboxylase PurE protein
MSVALLMGSDSDFGRLELGVETLRRLEIPVDVRVLSAHRTPRQLIEYVEAAPEKGIRIFLCAAGGAAHLAGVVAAHTALPVIGIPMDNPPLGGLDALLATVQMPPGVPVATVGVGGGGPMNAALFAARILALQDEGIRERYAEFCREQAERVLAKDEKIQRKLKS